MLFWVHKERNLEFLLFKRVNLAWCLHLYKYGKLYKLNGWVLEFQSHFFFRMKDDAEVRNFPTLVKYSTST